MTRADPRAGIRTRALALGFDAVGFAGAELGETARRNLAEYLARGYHGDMGWLAKRTDERASPAGLWPAARSVVVLGLNYGPGADPTNCSGPRCPWAWSRSAID